MTEVSSGFTAGMVPDSPAEKEKQNVLAQSDGGGLVAQSCPSLATP